MATIHGFNPNTPADSLDNEKGKVKLKRKVKYPPLIWALVAFTVFNLGLTLSNAYFAKKHMDEAIETLNNNDIKIHGILKSHKEGIDINNNNAKALFEAFMHLQQKGLKTI